MKRQQNKFKSENPYHIEDIKKLKTSERRHLTFKNILNDSDQNGLFWNNELIVLFETNFDMQKYNQIFLDYVEKEYPIILENGQPKLDSNNNPIRDTGDKEITDHNQRITKLRLIALLKLLSTNLDFSDSDDQNIQVWDSLSTSIQHGLQEKITETINYRYKYTKERKRFANRELLCFNPEEKNGVTLKRKELGIKDQKDNRSIDSGITEQFILVELYKEYGLPYEIFKNALMDNLSLEDEHVIDVLKAHYSLRAEQTEKMHKEMEKERKSS